MTVYTFALGLVFWGAHSSPTQRAIAAASLGGLVPILLSQHSLRRAQPVDHRATQGKAADRPRSFSVSAAGAHELGITIDRPLKRSYPVGSVVR